MVNAQSKDDAVNTPRKTPDDMQDVAKVSPRKAVQLETSRDIIACDKFKVGIRDDKLLGVGQKFDTTKAFGRTPVDGET